MIEEVGERPHVLTCGKWAKSETFLLVAVLIEDVLVTDLALAPLTEGLLPWPGTGGPAPSTTSPIFGETAPLSFPLPLPPELDPLRPEFPRFTAPLPESMCRERYCSIAGETDSLLKYWTYLDKLKLDEDMKNVLNILFILNYQIK